MHDLVNVGKHEGLLKSLLPGPFTIILPTKNKVCPLLESERNTLGVRYPAYPWIQELVHTYGNPLTSTSANISGYPPHYEPLGFINELSETKRKLIDFVIDAGHLPKNKPSTIVDLTGSSLKLLRQGDILPIAKQTFQSNSVQETKQIAQFLIEKYASQVGEKPLTFIVKGEMGVGKTVFAQGLGDYLGVEHVISPTYVVYYEYVATKNKFTVFLHADLYNIEDAEEFVHLGLEEYLKKGAVLCVEWGERIGYLFEKIKKHSKVIIIEMNYKGEKKRTVIVKEL